MPLPQNGADWPPKAVKPGLELMDLHDAWYTGDANILANRYQNQRYQNHSAQYRGGLVGIAARFWWGRPLAHGEHRVKLHLPLAGDIATMSSDLLFSEPPRVVLDGGSKSKVDGTIQKSPEQEKVEQIVNTPEAYTALLEAAELGSALGGSFLRLVWDRERMEHVRIEPVSADAAVPTFRSGMLTEVVFWSVVSDHEDEKVVRHVELVEPGKVTHALYEGTGDSIGERVSFDASRATQWLLDLEVSELNGVGGDTRGMERVLATGVKGITACYIPNQLPNRLFRKNAYLGAFGRSDYSGAEGAFDAIDEAWSSWARDVRLAKARIIVPQSYLDGLGPGEGASFDTEREVYEGMEFLTSDPASKAITPQQFKIRNSEHEATITEWTRYALRSAGYSPSSLGEKGNGTQRTATEVTAEERLSERTRDKKINYWKAGLRSFIRTWIELDGAVYGNALTLNADNAFEIRFPTESQQDPEEAARVAAMQAASQSASAMTRVRSMHPEWDGDAVNAEVDRIYLEQGIGAAEPDAATYNGIKAKAANEGPMGDEEAREMEARLRARNGEE
jgi:hypothetical protein